MRLAFLLLVALGLAACSSSTGASGVSPDDITVINSPDDLPEEYVVLGVVTPESRSSRSGYGSRDTRIADAKRRAAQLGADALVIVQDNSAHSDAMIQQFIRDMANGQSATSVNRTEYIAIRIAPPAE